MMQAFWKSIRQEMEREERREMEMLLYGVILSRFGRLCRLGKVVILPAREVFFLIIKIKRKVFKQEEKLLLES